jgi:hypothetical protein
MRRQMQARVVCETNQLPEGELLLRDWLLEPYYHDVLDRVTDHLRSELAAAPPTAPRAPAVEQTALEATDPFQDTKMDLASEDTDTAITKPKAPLAEPAPAVDETVILKPVVRSGAKRREETTAQPGRPSRWFGPSIPLSPFPLSSCAG